MSDSEGTTQPGPASEGTPRESSTGRYVSQPGAGKDGEGEKAPEEKEGRKRWLLLLILLLILLLLLCAGFAYMKWWKKDPPTEATPSPTAISTTATTQPSPTATATSSPSPSPTPTGPKLVAMPNVVGKPAAEAKTILEAAGFINIKFVAEGKPNESLSLLVSYVVTQQTPAAGTQVPVDSAVVITAKTSSNGKG